MGVLAEFVPIEAAESEYTGTLSIQWTEAPNWPAVRPRTDLHPPSLYAEMKAWWDAAIADVLAPISAARRSVEAVETAIDDVNITFARFGAVALEVRATGASALQVYRGVGEVLATIVTQGDRLGGAFAAPFAAMAQSDDPLSQMRARAWGGQINAGGRRARQKAALERGYYRSVEIGDLLGTHVVTQGETIWGIAWRWYGDTTAWTLIAQRNVLPGTTLRAGTRLSIPRRKQSV